MNRSELVEAVAEAAGIERRQAESAVSAVLDTLMAEVKSGNKVSLYGFGTFAPSQRAARTGRNPQTGEPVKIAASTGVRFAPATAFKQALNPRRAAAKKAAGKKAAGKKAAPAKKAAKKSAAAKKR